VNVSAWHTIPAAEMEPVYRAEATRWRQGLAWETAATWDLVEQSRQRGLVPADGAICGWSFHLRHRDTLQIGSVCAAATDVTAALVAAVLDSREAHSASHAMAFTLAGAPGLDACFAARGFAVGTYRYLQQPLSGLGRSSESGVRQPPVHLLRTWRSDDAPAIARLLAAAYEGVDPLRPFGGDGRAEDWSEYLAQLITETGCGRFCPQRSLVAVGSQGNLDGAALITDLGAGTAHLAQLVVAPPVHGAGLGRRLLREVMIDASRAGFERMSLLVGEQNAPARSLYARTGFEESAVFLTAAAPGACRPAFRRSSAEER
jgi:ribosomal protein S18 acetylase RimI-like enzyme